MKATQLWGPQQRNVHLGLPFNAFKNGALMSRNISTPLLNGHARAIFERFNSSSFHALFITTSKSLKPLFLQRFVTISWVFLAPPPKPSTRIFSAHKRITAKVRFVNKVGALFVSKKRFWNPYFYSVSCDKSENAIVFWTLPCPISKPKPCKKTLFPEGSTCFRPNTPIMKNGKKYIDPSRLALPTSPPHKVQHKMTAPKPRRTNKQPRD